MFFEFDTSICRPCSLKNRFVHKFTGYDMGPLYAPLLAVPPSRSHGAPPWGVLGPQGRAKTAPGIGKSKILFSFSCRKKVAGGGLYTKRREMVLRGHAGPVAPTKPILGNVMGVFRVDRLGLGKFDQEHHFRSS